MKKLFVFAIAAIAVGLGAFSAKALAGSNNSCCSENSACCYEGASCCK